MKDVTQSQNKDSWVVWSEQGFEMNSKWNAIQMMGVPAASNPNTERYAFVSLQRTVTDACCSAMRKILRADVVEDPQFPVLFQRKIRARAKKHARSTILSYCASGMHKTPVVENTRNSTNIRFFLLGARMARYLDSIGSSTITHCAPL